MTLNSMLSRELGVQNTRAVEQAAQQGAQQAAQQAAQQGAQQAAQQAAQQGAQQAAQQARAAADLAREQAQAARDQARDQIRDAIRNANDAVQGIDVAQPPAPPAPPAPPGTIFIPTGENGGDPISINVDGSGIHLMQNGNETVIPIRDVVPRGAVQMTYALCAAFAFVIVGYPLARAFARWLDRRGNSAQLSSGVQQRLDAMERNIDTVAEELERVSEGQRFTTKLLSERQPEFAAAAREAVDVSRGGR